MEREEPEVSARAATTVVATAPGPRGPSLELADARQRWVFEPEPPDDAPEPDDPVRSALREASIAAVLRMRAAAPHSGGVSIVPDASTEPLPCPDSAASKSATPHHTGGVSLSKTRRQTVRPAPLVESGHPHDQERQRGSPTPGCANRRRSPEHVTRLRDAANRMIETVITTTTTSAENPSATAGPATIADAFGVAVDPTRGKRGPRRQRRTTNGRARGSRPWRVLGPDRLVRELSAHDGRLLAQSALLRMAADQTVEAWDRLLTPRRAALGPGKPRLTLDDLVAAFHEARGPHELAETTTATGKMSSSSVARHAK